MAYITSSFFNVEMLLATLGLKLDKTYIAFQFNLVKDVWGPTIKDFISFPIYLESDKSYILRDVEPLSKSYAFIQRNNIGFIGSYIFTDKQVSYTEDYNLIVVDNETIHIRYGDSYLKSSQNSLEFTPIKSKSESTKLLYCDDSLQVAYVNSDETFIAVNDKKVNITPRDIHSIFVNQRYICIPTELDPISKILCIDRLTENINLYAIPELSGWPPFDSLFVYDKYCIIPTHGYIIDFENIKAKKLAKFCLPIVIDDKLYVAYPETLSEDSGFITYRTVIKSINSIELDQNIAFTKENIEITSVSTDYQNDLSPSSLTVYQSSLMNYLKDKYDETERLNFQSDLVNSFVLTLNDKELSVIDSFFFAIGKLKFTLDNDKSTEIYATNVEHVSSTSAIAYDENHRALVVESDSYIIPDVNNKDEKWSFKVRGGQLLYSAFKPNTNISVSSFKKDIVDCSVSGVIEEPGKPCFLNLVYNGDVYSIQKPCIPEPTTIYMSNVIPSQLSPYFLFNQKHKIYSHDIVSLVVAQSTWFIQPEVYTYDGDEKVSFNVDDIVIADDPSPTYMAHCSIPVDFEVDKDIHLYVKVFNSEEYRLSTILQSIHFPTHLMKCYVNYNLEDDPTIVSYVDFTNLYRYKRDLNTNRLTRILKESYDDHIMQIDHPNFVFVDSKIIDRDTKKLIYEFDEYAASYATLHNGNVYVVEHKDQTLTITQVDKDSSMIVKQWSFNDVSDSTESVGFLHCEVIGEYLFITLKSDIIVFDINNETKLVHIKREDIGDDQYAMNQLLYWNRLSVDNTVRLYTGSGRVIIDFTNKKWYVEKCKVNNDEFSTYFVSARIKDNQEQFLIYALTKQSWRLVLKSHLLLVNGDTVWEFKAFDNDGSVYVSRQIACDSPEVLDVWGNTCVGSYSQIFKMAGDVSLYVDFDNLEELNHNFYSLKQSDTNVTFEQIASGSFTT